MNNHNFVIEEIDYGRKLIQAGVHGLQACPAKPALVPQLMLAARLALKSAAVGAGAAWIGCKVLKCRQLRGSAMLACSTLAFCADFGWRTRVVRSQLLNGAAKEISKVRDQHWLESNPIDYA